MHLDEERIQRVLHAELTAAASEEVRSHLGSCETCRSRVVDAEREEARIFGLLRELDHPLPRIHDDVTPVRLRGRPLWWRVAASIVIGIAAAGAAYAASGFPLPRMFQRLVEWVGHAPRQNPEVSVPPGVEAPSRGIAVTPGDRLAILFSAAQTGAVVTISLTDDSDVEVRTLRGQATFTSDLDRLQIDSKGDSAHFQILIPRGAPLVEVQLGGRQVFLKQGARVVTQARPDARGDYLILLNW
jgi:hypothetical protein